jgi:hypothetical protein
MNLLCFWRPVCFDGDVGFLRAAGGSLLALAAFAVAQEPPIPDAPTLLREVQAHQQQVIAVRENYTFHRKRVEDELDKKGAVTKTTTQEREIFFVNGRQVGRLVSRNGVGLNAAEQKKEDARVRDVVETITKNASKAGGRPRRMDLVSEMLAVAKTSNPRRVSFNGRATLVFDFTGDPRAEAHGLAENGLKKAAGTVWIDEADRQVARIEARLYDNFRIGGGLLASVQKGSHIVVEQALVGQGLWLPKSSEQSVDARIVIKGAHLRIHEEDFDFKRFNVETLQQIGAPVSQ